MKSPRDQHRLHAANCDRAVLRTFTNTLSGSEPRYVSSTPPQYPSIRKSPKTSKAYRSRSDFRPSGITFHNDMCKNSVYHLNLPPYVSDGRMLLGSNTCGVPSRVAGILIRHHRVRPRTLSRGEKCSLCAHVHHASYENNQDASRSSR